MRKAVILLLGLSLCLGLYASRPVKLRVDLLRHPETGYSGGYVSSAGFGLPAAGTVEYPFVLTPDPAFSWQNDATVCRQEAYRILVATTPELLAEGRADIWDSGKHSSGRQSGIRLPVSLAPARIFYWTVKVWADGREGEYARRQSFRTGGDLSTGQISHAPLERTDRDPVYIYEYEKGRMFDFGQDAFGCLRLTCNGRTGDTLVVRLGERATSDGRHVRLDPEGTSIRSAVYDLPLRNGVHTYRITCMPDPRNTGAQAVKMPVATGEVTPFRYAEVTGSGIRWIRAVRETVNYPFDDEATRFECSEEALNEIWQLCKQTVKATSFTGIYIDGDRERIPYEVDALINQLSHYAVDPDYTMARRTARYLVDHPTWPTEWILQNLTIAWNDYLYTGDNRLIDGCYTDLKAKTLQALQDETGLISTRNGRMTREVLDAVHFAGSGLRDIVDWPHTGRQGPGGESLGEIDGFQFCRYNAVVNAWFYEAVSKMALISETLGKPEAAAWRAVQKQLYTDYNRLFYDRRRGVYRDGDSTEHASLHTQMFALCFGLVPEKNRERLLDYMTTRGMACSVYGAQFLLDALYDNGRAEEALSLMLAEDDRGWLNMMAEGSTLTLEAWSGKYKPNLDWNHAWGTAPANVIVRKLMGVEPLVPGFARFSVRPQTGNLEYARLTYATLRGEIVLDIRQREGAQEARLQVPPNSTAEFELPPGSRKGSVVCNGEKMKQLRFALGSGNNVITWNN